jgi:hypothetical protein
VTQNFSRRFQPKPTARLKVIHVVIPQTRQDGVRSGRHGALR